MNQRPAGFPSFMGGGFECSSHRRADGKRLDVIAATGHDVIAAQDYARLSDSGLLWARDGLRWHQIETAPGRHDWDSWSRQLDGAEAAGTSVWWDLVHFGIPDIHDIWSADFPRRVAEFAAAAADVHRQRTGRPGQFCPLNEIGYMAFAGGEMGWMYPNAHGQGYRLKEQLVRSAIAAAGAIRAVDPAARLLWAEPLIHVACSDASLQAAADDAIAAQFEALDWVLGRARPDLGGDPALADVIGWNHYPHNQWWIGGSTAAFGAPGFKALSDLLALAAARYPKHPMLLAETGAEGPARAGWLHYVGQECQVAIGLGVPLLGACLYPVTHYPGWENNRICPTGLFGMRADAHRDTDAPSLVAVRALEQAMAN
ncbi:beta-glucosidase [Sandarakinorhabdus rubra]|uniref:beta-glucosidase n=1 Tax=Sandarakinorhabdus rubra TaxID=2672568 RepID=UPI0013DB4AC4|nr:beta-glucosidase [Sandarakinorhabdus rubra]